MKKRTDKRTRVKRLARIVAVVCAGVLGLAIVMNTAISTVYRRRVNQVRAERQNALQRIVNHIEYIGLDDEAKQLMLQHSERYTDFSNFIVTDAGQQVLYSLNQGHLDGSGVFRAALNDDGFIEVLDASGQAKGVYRNEGGETSMLRSVAQIARPSLDADRMFGRSWPGEERIYYAGFPSKNVQMFFFFNPSNPKWTQGTGAPNGLAQIVSTPLFGALIALCIVSYFVALAMWVYLDAAQRDAHPALWGVLTLFMNAVGLIVYLAVRPERLSCSSCGYSLEPGFISCPACGAKCRAQCPSCKHVTDDGWTHCPYCGIALAPAAPEPETDAQNLA